MSKNRDIDQIFKEGFEEYKAKADSGLEKKMAVVLGVSFAGGGSSGDGNLGGSGSSDGGLGSTGSSLSGATGSGSVAIGTAGKATFFSKTLVTSGGFINSLGVNAGLLLKSLGIVKTIGTIVTIGTATIATVMIAEEIREDKIIQQQAESKTKTEALTGLSPKVLFGLNTYPQIKYFDAKEWDEITDAEHDVLRKPISQRVDASQQADKNATATRKVAVVASKSNTGVSSKHSSAKKTLDNIPSSEKGVELPVVLTTKPIGYLSLANNIPILQKDELKLQTPVPQPKSMNSLEKGFYSTNYTITSGFYAMPFTANQVYKNDFSNDSISSHQIAYHPQWSVQAGADIRIQKKRKPWFLQLGINYMHLKQEKELRFSQEYIDHGQSYWNIDSVYYYYINPPFLDSSLARVDSSYFEFWIRNNTNQKSQETYHFINIPLQVGYEYKNYSKKWHLEAAAGISTSILLQGKGITYNSSGQIIDFSSGQLTPKLQFFAVGQLAFNYQLNKLTLFIKPTFKYQLSKISYDSSIEKNQFLIFGTQIGVRFKLFNNAGQP